jgi:Zn finger protein HypA/HybF involved in hydrogenase expression
LTSIADYAIIKTREEKRSMWAYCPDCEEAVETKTIKVGLYEDDEQEVCPNCHGEALEPVGNEPKGAGKDFFGRLAASKHPEYWTE